MILKVLRQAGTSSKNSVRKIFKTNIEIHGERIFIELTGSGFLYNMMIYLKLFYQETDKWQEKPYHLKVCIY